MDASLTPERLQPGHPGREQAVTELRIALLGGLRAAFAGNGSIGEAQLADFAQDALLRVLDKLDSFSGRGRLIDWAHAIAINTAFAELRRKRWRDVSLDQLLADGAKLEHFEIPASASDGADEAREAIFTELRAAVAAQLTQKQRAIITGELDEIPFDQIAQILGTNRNAAYKLAHDARRALKRHLELKEISADDIRHAFTT